MDNQDETLTDIKLDPIANTEESLPSNEAYVSKKPLQRVDIFNRITLFSYVITTLICSSLSIAFFIEATTQLKGRLLPPRHFGSNYYGALFFPVVSICFSLFILIFGAYNWLRQSRWIAMNYNPNRKSKFPRTVRVLTVFMIVFFLITIFLSWLVVFDLTSTHQYNMLRVKHMRTLEISEYETNHTKTINAYNWNFSKTMETMNKNYSMTIGKFYANHSNLMRYFANNYSNTLLSIQRNLSITKANDMACVSRCNGLVNTSRLFACCYACI